MKTANNLNALISSLVVEELSRLGCDFFCLAPGSRSTPLTVAVAQNEKVQSIMCYDERSLGFFALGVAKARQKPVAIVCTSGTAVANLLPAVVEASNDKVPLLVLTADRPPELRGVGANQTIDQVKIFGDFVRGFVDMPAPDDRILARAVLGTIDFAFARAMGPLPGPVHVNCMFREPLEPTYVEEFDRACLHGLERWMESGKPLVEYLDFSPFSKGGIEHLIEGARNGVIVAGSVLDADDQQAILALARHIQWPILADITSNLRLVDDPLIIHHIDHLLLHPRFADQIPEVVIQLGGRITSKRLQQFLDRRRGKPHLFVDRYLERCDPGFTVTHHVAQKISFFAQGLMPALTKSSHSGELEVWQAGSRTLAKLFDEKLSDSSDLSEPYVARAISKLLPSEHVLYLSSSMPIRDVDMFASARSTAPWVVSNRGVSGIDGVTSSACGFALGSSRPLTLLIGDLAFLHDANGLSWLAKLSVPVIVVVVNNRGGGIFSFLPIAKSQDVFGAYFDTPHEHVLEGLSHTFGLKHTQVDTVSGFNDVYRHALQSGRPQVIEVASNTQTNIAFHEQLKALAYQALDV
jgi:2-succinyl-5-enolpyruvyl-6-hydroxy-3-cyclohexene-1-carboxylate synthase